LNITCYVCDGDGAVPIRFDPLNPFAARETICPNCDGSGYHDNPEFMNDLETAEKPTPAVDSSALLAEALRGLLKLLDDEDLVRNTDGDDDVMVFMLQGVKITNALRLAKEALDSITIEENNNDPKEENDNARVTSPETGRD
jgi:hypothetical protein